jgi:hypothetical protein
VREKGEKEMKGRGNGIISHRLQARKWNPDEAGSVNKEPTKRRGEGSRTHLSIRDGHDLRNETGTDGLSTLSERESGPDLERGVVGEGADHLDVVSGHDHLLVGALGALRESEVGSDVGGSDEHLDVVWSGSRGRGGGEEAREKA